MSIHPKNTLDYKTAGVDINAGNQLVEMIKPDVKQTFRPEVMTNIGGFGAMFELPFDRYKKPVLVSGTDGVGTKLKLALASGKHDTIGIDLVAMCVNDIIVQGAEPLFFLDYYATGTLDVDTAAKVIKGIAEGCKQAGAALIGGETAEMPGMYTTGEYDLAGFCVGIVEKEDIIDGHKVAPDDILIGINSSGPHSNGYSLIRKIIEIHQIDIDQPFAETTLIEALIAPTRIYVKAILALLKKIDIHAIAHITGGGLLENIPRVMPDHTCAILDLDFADTPPLFQWLRQKGNIEINEMYRTFNCGIGMVIVVNKNDAEETIRILGEHQELAKPIGVIQESEIVKPRVIFKE